MRCVVKCNGKYMNGAGNFVDSIDNARVWRSKKVAMNGLVPYYKDDFDFDAYFKKLGYEFVNVHIVEISENSAKS